MNLLAELRRDHDRLRATMTLLETAPADPATARAFAADLAAHARLEDELLFHELEHDLPQAAILDAMRAEHREIDALLEGLLRGERGPSLDRLLRVARGHFLKEEKVLFEFAERLIDSERLAALGAAWRQAHFGAGEAAAGPTPTSRVADLAREHPATVRVFQRLGIDFCCGGKLPLSEACAKRGLAVDVVAEELRRAIASSDRSSDVAWDGRPAVELVGHVLARYHAGLRDELSRLDAMAARAADRHGETHPELVEIRSLVSRLAERMRAHLEHEERVLFPAILSGDTAALGGDLTGAEDEHREIGDLLDRLREASDGFRPPAEACNTWRGLFHGLAELERDTHEHVHLENNILFPGALASACTL